MDNNIAQDTKSTKLDSNGDEIIWELEIEKNLFFWLWSWVARISLVWLCCYFVFAYLSNITGWKRYMLFIVASGIVLYFGITIYKTLNLKKLYATTNNLYLQRYIGDSIILPLGSFYISCKIGDYSFQTLATLTRISIISLTETKRKYYFEISIKNDNFACLEKIIKPIVENCLISLNDNDYNNVLLMNIKYDVNRKYTLQVDFDRVERLRKEKENGK